MERTLIERFAAGGPTLRRAVQGLIQADITQRMAPGTWSILELVVHLSDSDAVVIDRMKRIISEDNPTLLSFSEDGYIARLHPHEQTLDDAVALFEIGRRQFARVLRASPDSDFARTGMHNVNGAVSVGDLLSFACGHLDHHLKFLDGKRERLGKPAKP